MVGITLNFLIPSPCDVCEGKTSQVKPAHRQLLGNHHFDFQMFSQAMLKGPERAIYERLSCIPSEHLGFHCSAIQGNSVHVFLEFDAKAAHIITKT